MASTWEDFLAMGKSNLEDFLAVRGISKSGKKIELVAKAFSAVQMNFPIILSSEEMQRRLDAEYNARLKRNNIIDPKEVISENRVDDITKWPTITLGRVFEYILRCKDFETDYIGRFKDERAYSYYDSGFVDAITLHEGDGITFMYCQVQSSMTVTNWNSLWIAVKFDGVVLTGWCSCMAGSSECCNHIIATLYKVEYATTHGFTQPACTSIPCAWNSSTKREVKPKRIADIVVRKKVRTQMKDTDTHQNREEIRQEKLKNFDPRNPLHRTKTDEEVSSLLQVFHESNPSAVLFKSIEGMSIDSSSLESCSIVAMGLEVGSKPLPDDEKINSFLAAMFFPQSKRDRLEKVTRGQSKNKSWLEARKGRLTASKHHDIYTKVNSVLKSKGEIKPKTTPMVAELIYGKNDLSHLAPIKWGLEHEDVALKSFYAIEATKHAKYKIHNVGLFVDRTRCYIGASPDAVMTCSCHRKVSIEIKCPKSIHDKVIDKNSVKSCDFLEVVDDAISLKKTHKYYTQVISQIELVQASMGYFVVWTEKDTFIQKIEKDTKHWEAVSLNLDLFFKNFMIKPLLGIEQIKYCGICDKVILRSNEIPTKEKDAYASIGCSRCRMRSHMICLKINHPKDAYEWICDPCIASMMDEN